MKKLNTIIAAVIITAVLSGCTANDNSHSAVYSDKTSVSKGVVAYFFNSAYQSFVTQYKSQLDSLGIDTKVSLAEQNCTLSDEKITWYDYFMNSAEETVKTAVILKDTYTKVSQADVDSRIKKALDILKDNAKSDGMTVENYIKMHFGEDVSYEDAKFAIELESHSKASYDTFIKSLDMSDEKTESYFRGHKKSYCTVDYFYFCVPGPESQDLYEINRTRQIADELAEKKTEKEFTSYIEKYMREYIENMGLELTEKEISKKIKKNLDAAVCNNVQYTDNSFGNWAFDSDRKKGESLVITNPDDNGYFVYVLKNPPKRNTSKITTLRQIQIDISDKNSVKSAKEKLENIKKQVKSENYSEAVFISTAASFSDDKTTSNSGGLYKDAVRGDFSAKPDIENWVFSKDRKVGDCEIITTDKSVHLIYIENIGDEAWKKQVTDGYKAVKFNNFIEESGDDCLIHINSNIISQIKQIDIG